MQPLRAVPTPVWYLWVCADAHVVQQEGGEVAGRHGFLVCLAASKDVDHSVKRVLPELGVGIPAAWEGRDDVTRQT